MALALLCVASFMAVVDTTIVSIALPSIRRAMEFSPSGSQWVLNAYALVFGGLLLLFESRRPDGTSALFIVGAISLDPCSMHPLSAINSQRHRTRQVRTGGIDDKCHHLRSRQYGNGDR
jgi:MFS family permease